MTDSATAMAAKVRSSSIVKRRPASEASTKRVENLEPWSLEVSVVPRRDRQSVSSRRCRDVAILERVGTQRALPTHSLAPCLRSVAWTSGFPSAIAMSDMGSPFPGALMSAPAATRRSTTAQ